MNKPCPKQVAAYNALKEEKRRVSVCMTCQHWNPKGCSLYLRPCTITQLWKDQVPPPENCPRKDQFE